MLKTIPKWCWPAFMAATNTRPDISVVVNSLGSKSANPNVHDYEKLIYCLRYIKNSMGYHIEYKRNRLNIPPKSFVIECFSDASFAPGLDRKSISGTLIYVNGNLVQWATKTNGHSTKLSSL